MPANSAGDLSWGWRKRDPSKDFWWPPIRSRRSRGHGSIHLVFVYDFWGATRNLPLAHWNKHIKLSLLDNFGDSNFLFGPVAYRHIQVWWVFFFWQVISDVFYPKSMTRQTLTAKRPKKTYPQQRCMPHGYGIPTYINFNHNNQPNVGKYIPFMDLMMGCTYLVHKPVRLDPDKVPHQTVPSRHDQPWPSRHWVLLFHRSASSFGLRILRLVGLDSHSWCWGRIWHTTSTAWMPQEVSNWWANGYNLVLNGVYWGYNESIY